MRGQCRSQYTKTGSDVNHPTAKARDLQLPRAGCRHRPIDCGPIGFSSGNVEGGVVVRVQREATSLAKERFLRFPIRLLTVPTGRTRPAGSPWVYQMHRHAGPGGFVGEELAQLEEGPGVPFVAMFVPNRYPLANPAQVFESQCLARYDGFLHQGL